MARPQRKAAVQARERVASLAVSGESRIKSGQRSVSKTRHVREQESHSEASQGEESSTTDEDDLSDDNVKGRECDDDDRLFRALRLAQTPPEKVDLKRKLQITHQRQQRQKMSSRGWKNSGNAIDLTDENFLIMQPNPLPKRIMPLATTVSSHEEAKQRLHVSAVPDSLPCREDEFASIYMYLESAIQEQRGACLYISGVPGTGKTATVFEVIRMLQAQVTSKDLLEFKFVEVNGMKVLDPAHTYTIVYQALTGEKVTAVHAQQLLAHRFTTHASKSPMTIILLDELDLLVTKRQGIMYNFFDWPNQPNAKLIVIAIANTMDLPERMLTKRISSRIVKGLTRVDFQPYTEQQLVYILKSRVNHLMSNDDTTLVPVISDNAMIFAARKVANVNGDARRLLDICRRAVEIVHHRFTHSINTDSCRTVEPQDIAQASNEMYSSILVKYLTKASTYQKLCMMVIVSATRKAGVNEVDFVALMGPYHQLCVVANVSVPTHSQFEAVLSSLAAIRCILLDTTHLSVASRLQLNMSEQDVRMALRNDPFSKRLL